MEKEPKQAYLFFSKGKNYYYSDFPQSTKMINKVNRFFKLKNKCYVKSLPDEVWQVFWLLNKKRNH